MQNQNNLAVFKEAYTLGIEVYNFKYPDTEKFGIQQQIRRAVISITLNLAEGCGRQSDKDFLRFLYMAYGSMKEVETLLEYSKDLNFVVLPDYSLFKERLNRIAKQLNMLIQSVRNSKV